MTPRLAPLAVALALPACFADRTAPDDLPCERESDCPESQTCRTKLGKCVAVDGLDGEPPRATDIVITPTTMKRDTELRVTFTTEPLLDPPIVSADTNDVAFTLLGNEDDTWTFSATPDEHSVEGDHDLRADLVDEAGNAARVALGTVTFDFTSPQVSDCSFDPAVFSASDPLAREVVIELVLFGEDVTIVDLELMGPDDAWFLDYDLEAGLGETHLSATWTNPGTETPGTYAITYVARDAVGNEANAMACQLTIEP